MKEDKRNLIAMLRRRLISLKKTNDKEREEALLKQIQELVTMLKTAING